MIKLLLFVAVTVACLLYFFLGYTVGHANAEKWWKTKMQAALQNADIQCTRQCAKTFTLPDPVANPGFMVIVVEKEYTQYVETGKGHYILLPGQEGSFISNGKEWIVGNFSDVRVPILTEEKFYPSQCIKKEDK